MDKPIWMDAPEPHDFDAARHYLGLVLALELADTLVARLRTSPMQFFQAKDLLRASQLPLLGRDNEHVKSDFHKVDNGTLLSPVLLVRGRVGSYPLLVADGYHRICTSYHLDENTPIPCGIADMP
jgi:hypothetical protein